MFSLARLISRGSILVFSLFRFIPIATTTPICRIVTIPIKLDSAPASKLPLSLQLNYLSILTAPVLSGLKTTISGTYDIVGRYCEPENNVDSRKNTLQLLAHPATYDKDWWSGSAAPGFGYDGDRYDYVTWASKLGYPTFAFDRLGNGQSSHPDPILVVQCPLQAEVIHQLVLKARAGPTAASNAFPRPFKKIILAGASLGSIIANELTAAYPNDVDAVILGAFSKSWILAVPGFVITALLLPAATIDPVRYGGLPIGYLIGSSPSGVAFELFYGPGKYYDEMYIDWDYRSRGTISVGEGVTGAVGIMTANKYKGDVLVITGQQDVPFCGSLGLTINGPGNCGSGKSSILEQTRSLYPVAKSYTWFAVPNSGHCWMHQYNAKLGFKVMTDWLEEKGF